MLMALVSLMTERTVRSDTAMTGEISLRGLVLPVGGIREKVVAAARAGIKRVLLPARNRKDYDEIPVEVRRYIEFIWLETVDDAVACLEAPAVRPNSEAINPQDPVASGGSTRTQTLKDYLNLNRHLRVLSSLDLAPHDARFWARALHHPALPTYPRTCNPNGFQRLKHEHSCLIARVLESPSTTHFVVGTWESQESAT
jgi:predicted S18 family serine protease